MLDIGDVVPDFELLNQDGKRTRLSDYRGRRVVIFTFPKAGTLGCTIQACGLRDRFENLISENTVVLGLSTDSPEALATWKQRQRLPYDLLSDPDHHVMALLGGWGMSLLGFTLSRPNRTLWVIDEKGVIFDRRVPVGALESAAQALQILQRMPAPAGL